MKTIKLRDYQKQAIASIYKNWEAGSTRVILSLPTGGGKTETAIALMNEVNKSGACCLVIVERIVLCAQWVKRLQDHDMTNTGILQGSKTSLNKETKIIVATAQTIASRGIACDFGLVIIDECQYWHQSHMNVLKSISAETKVIGLSATPFNLKMSECFDSVVAPVSINQLIKTDYLVPSRTFIPRLGDSIQQTLASVPIDKSDFALGKLDGAMRSVEIMGDIVREWSRLGENRPTIAFCVSVLHAKALAIQFIDFGVTAAAITQDNNLAQRNQIIADFESGKLKVLTSVNVLAVGFDSPVASCAIFARPTLSKSLHIQMAGRVIRLFKGKCDAIMLDHAGNIERHGRIENFVVPQTLHELRATTDTVPRESRIQLTDVTCNSCGLLYLSTKSSCPECNHRRTKQVLRIVDGELQELTVGALDEPPGTDPAQISEFHVKALRYARWMGFKPAWAFYKTIERFALKGNPKGIELDKLIRPKGQRDRSWLTTHLNQNELDWFQTSSRIRFDISLDKINGPVQAFQIDTSKCLGWQSFSINRMQVDANHCLKAIICTAIAAKNDYGKITAQNMSIKIKNSTKGQISDIEVVARYMERKGICIIKSGALKIGKEKLPFSKTDCDRVLHSLRDSIDSHLSIPCSRESIFAGAI